MIEIFVGVLAALLVRDVIREWLRDRPGVGRYFDYGKGFREQPWMYRYFKKAQRVLGYR